jgi:hypothetical protein
LQSSSIDVGDHLSESVVKLIIKGALSVGQIRFPEPPHQPQGRIVEESQQVRGMTHPQLRMIFLKRAISARM